MTITLHLGDCIEVLKSLPDQSVQTCVTSPPYYGLRDYGTAKWEGGSQECDHKNGTLQSNKSTLHPGTSQNDKRNFDGMPYKDTCAKCGAHRIDDQIGLEPTPAEYVAKLVSVFREVKRVLRDDGTLWLNLWDSYANANPGSGGECKLKGAGKNMTESRYTNIKRDMTGIKPKDLLGIPWRVAFALQQPYYRCLGCENVAHASEWGRFPNGRLICPACELSKGHAIEEQGWYLRSDIIWHKPNPMPESVKDRPTKAHEYIFLMAKSQRYYYDAEAIAELLATEPHSPKNKTSGRLVYNGKTDNAVHQSERVWGLNGFRNKRTVWTVTTKPYREAHFATFPPDLIEPCVLAGTSAMGCCPKCGAGWLRVVEYVNKSESVAGKKTQQKRDAGLVTAFSGYADGSTAPTKITTGWQPSCSCDAGETVPCVVLDPFNGSGTTGYVALKNNRDYIGIELNPDYITLTDKRLATVQHTML